MAEKLILDKQGIENSSNELKTLSIDILEMCKVIHDEINELKETEAFKTMNASVLYYETIDRLNNAVPKYTEDVLKFSEFLSNYVITNYGETDEELKTAIESGLEEALEQINNVKELGNGVNLDKISTSAQGALNGDFIDSSKLKKSMFEDGELELKLRDDGTVQIMKNGTTLGFTTQDGITSGKTSNASSTATQTSEQTGNIDMNPIAEASTAAGGAVAAASSQPAPTITPSSSNTNFVGYTGQLHTKAKASDEVKASAGTITTGHQSYTIVPDNQYTKAPGTISQSDYNLLVAQVAGEGANSKDDMLGVTCTVLNRLEANGYGNSVHEVLEDGYFPWGRTYKSYMEAGKTYTGEEGVAASAGRYASTAAGQAKLQEAAAAVNDALSGARNVESDVFYYSGSDDHTYNKFSDNV